MVKVYDPKTKKEQEVDLSTANSGIASGKLAVKNNDTFNIVGPDNKAGSVSGSQLSEYLNSGYHLESPKEAKVNSYLERNQGIGGSAKAAAAGFANELTFGAAGATYSPELQALQKEHNVASGLGSTLGFGASMALPIYGELGRVGEAAASAVRLGRAAEEVGLGTKILSSAAKLGTESTLLAAPQAITEASLGDPTEAGEHLLYGLGAGAALGAAIPVFKPVASILGQALGKPIGLDLAANHPLDKMVTDQTMRSLMYGSDKRAAQQLEHVGEDAISNYLHANNLVKQVGEDFTSYGQKILNEKDNVGQQIGNIYQQLDTLGAQAEPTSKLIDKIKTDIIDPLKKVATKQPEVRALEQYTNDLNNASALIAGDKVGLNKEMDILTSLKSSNASPDLINAQQNKIDQLTNHLADNHNLSLTELWQQRQALDQKIFAEKRAAIGNPSPIHEELTKVRNLIQDEINSKANSLVGQENFTDKLDNLNKQFRYLNTVEDVVDNSAAAEKSRRNFSLSDYLTGGFGGVSASAAFSHPFGAVSGLAGGVANKFLRENGNSLIAQYGNKLSVYLADLAKKEAQGQLDKIPAALKYLVSNKTATVPQAASSAFTQLLGTEHKSDEQAFDDLNNKVNVAIQNPNQHIDGINQFFASGAPNIANAYQQQNQKVINYLYNALPKNPSAPQPFQTSKWKPSKQELRNLKDKVNIINNPYNSIDLLKNGRLNNNHVDALKNVYPSVYNNMVNQIMQYGSQNPKMPYKYKLQLSLLTGVDLDDSLKNVSFYQSAYAENDNPKANGAKIDLPGSEPTQQQRISEA